jgi:hypothetical protein
MSLSMRLHAFSDSYQKLDVKLDGGCSKAEKSATILMIVAVRLKREP